MNRKIQIKTVLLLIIVITGFNTAMLLNNRLIISDLRDEIEQLKIKKTD